MFQYLVLLSLPLAAFGGGMYIRDTITGNAKPNKISWLMWSVAPLIATFAAISKGVTWGVLPVFMSGFIPLCILITSFFSKKSYWKLTFFDYLCGFFSALALALWLILKDANIAIIFAIIADGSAAIPTLRKSWTNPETESGLPYLMGLISAPTSFAAISRWVFPAYGFALYLIIVDATLVFFIYRRKIFAKGFLPAGKNKV